MTAGFCDRVHKKLLFWGRAGESMGRRATYFAGLHGSRVNNAAVQAWSIKHCMYMEHPQHMLIT